MTKQLVFITILSLLSVVTWINAQTNGANSNSICYEPISNGSYVSLVEIPDNSSRILLADKNGRIVVYNKTSGEQIDIFVDISDIVLSSDQQGLLGLALHPNYTTNGKFYIFYTCNQQNCPVTCTSNDTCDSGNCFDGYCTRRNSNESIYSISYIAELSVNDLNSTTANASSLRNLVRIENPYPTNQGGWIAFGSDNYLYAGIGDGGSNTTNGNNTTGNNTESNEVNDSAQDLTVLLGKIIRIDIDNSGQNTNYSIPTSNPYANSQTARQEIYAIGLRNPWRCSFDKPTNRLFCGDDGQGNQQEIDIIYSGANYGWPRYDGNLLINENLTTVTNNVTFPIISYSPTNNQPWGVIGGFVYRGSRNPCSCGKYYYADSVLYQATQTSGNWSSTQVNSQCVGSDCVDFNYVYSFGQDAESDLYFLTDAGVFRFIEPSECGFQCNCSCVIDGVCLNANATNSNNTCQYCDPQYPCVWSTRSQCDNSTTSTSGTYGTTGNVPLGTTDSVVIPANDHSGISKLAISVSIVLVALIALIF